MKRRLSIPAGRAASGQFIALAPGGYMLAFEQTCGSIVYKARCMASSAGWEKGLPEIPTHSVPTSLLRERELGRPCFRTQDPAQPLTLRRNCYMLSESRPRVALPPRYAYWAVAHALGLPPV